MNCLLACFNYSLLNDLTLFYAFINDVLVVKPFSLIQLLFTIRLTSFDNRLNELFHQRIEAEQTVAREELAILMLAKSLQDEQDLVDEELNIRQHIDDCRRRQAPKAQAVQQALEVSCFCLVIIQMLTFNSLEIEIHISDFFCGFIIIISISKEVNNYKNNFKKSGQREKTKANILFFIICAYIRIHL